MDGGADLCGFHGTACLYRMRFVRLYGVRDVHGGLYRRRRGRGGVYLLSGVGGTGCGKFSDHGAELVGADFVLFWLLVRGNLCQGSKGAGPEKVYYTEKPDLPFLSVYEKKRGSHLRFGGAYGPDAEFQ